jgi:hypothetical protein
VFETVETNRRAFLGLITTGTVSAIAFGKQPPNPELDLLLKKVFEATGGLETVKKGLICRRTGKGQMKAGEMDLEFKEDILTGGLDKFRFTLVLNNTTPITVGLLAENGWTSSGGGSAIPLPPERVREFRNEALVMHLATLAPLAEGKYPMKLLKLESVQGRDAIGVEILVPGQRPVIFHFDKGTMLMVKRTYQTLENGKPLLKEVYHREFADFAGLRLPTRETVLHNGKIYVDISEIKYTLYPRIDDSFFQKP